MVDAYFAARIEPIVSADDADRLRRYLKGLLEQRTFPPLRSQNAHVVGETVEVSNLVVRINWLH